MTYDTICPSCKWLQRMQCSVKPTGMICGTCKQQVSIKAEVSIKEITQMDTMNLSTLGEMTCCVTSMKGGQAFAEMFFAPPPHMSLAINEPTYDWERRCYT